jgi:hypothetical protein
MAKIKSGTTLSSIQQTLAGEGNSLEDIQNHQTEHEYSEIAKTESVEAPNEFVVFKLVNTKKKGRVYIDSINDNINPETGKVERLRLLSGVDKIWLKDQKDVTEDYAKNNRRSLIFESKILKIPYWDTAAIDFARNCSHFIDNPKRKTGSKTEFFEWNPNKQAEEALKKQHFMVKAMQKAFSVSDEVMKKHALYLNVSFIDEVGFAKQTESIRRDYALKAQQDPQRFMQTLESPLVEISFLVKKALSDSKIDVGRERNKAYWATGKFICSIPPHQAVHDYLVEFASAGSPESRDFLEQLKLTVR